VNSNIAQTDELTHAFNMTAGSKHAESPPSLSSDYDCRSSIVFTISWNIGNYDVEIVKDIKQPTLPETMRERLSLRSRLRMFTSY